MDDSELLPPFLIESWAGFLTFACAAAPLSKAAAKKQVMSVVNGETLFKCNRFHLGRRCVFVLHLMRFLKGLFCKEGCRMYH